MGTLVPASIVLTLVSVHALQGAAASPRMPDGYRRPKHFVDLAYPLEARAARVQGFVVLELEIDDRGRVASARVAAGSPLLAEPAAANARDWVFEPQAGRTALVYRFDIDTGLCNDETRSLFRLESPTLATITACSAPGRDLATWPDDDLEVLDMPRVEYPHLARSARIHGAVVVRLSLAADGAVVSATALAGPLLLVDAAVSSARRWTFAATTRRQAIVVYEFRFMERTKTDDCGVMVVNEVLYPGYIRIGASTPCLQVSTEVVGTSRPD